MPQRLSKSVRKFVRKEKARLRREIVDPAEVKRRIEELLAGVLGHAS